MQVWVHPILMMIIKKVERYFSKLNELYSKADLVIKVQRPFKQKKTDEFKLLNNCNLITLLYEQKFKNEFSSLKEIKY